MKTTIKQVRQMIDEGLIKPEETKGITVNVGFMKLTIIGYEETPGDGYPNIWHLAAKGKEYRFTPYYGLEAK